MTLNLYKTLTAALILFGLPLLARAQSVPQTDIDFAKQKYQIAGAISKMAEKCKYSEADLTEAGIHSVLRATAEISVKDYGAYLNTIGHSAFVSSMDAQIAAATESSVCRQYKTDPNVQSFVQSGGILINEMLYAISLSGVSECGDVTALIAPVVTEAKRIAPSLSTRPDLDLLHSLAEPNAETFREMCDDDDMFDGDYLFMAHDPFGKLVFEMAEFLKK